jgi:hypothetical protein
MSYIIIIWVVSKISMHYRISKSLSVGQVWQARNNRKIFAFGCSLMYINGLLTADRWLLDEVFFQHQGETVFHHLLQASVHRCMYSSWLCHAHTALQFSIPMLYAIASFVNSVRSALSSHISIHEFIYFIKWIEWNWEFIRSSNAISISWQITLTQHDVDLTDWQRRI